MYCSLSNAAPLSTVLIKKSTITPYTEYSINKWVYIVPEFNSESPASANLIDRTSIANKSLTMF